MPTKRTKANDLAIPTAASAAPVRRKSATTSRAKHGLKASTAATEPKAETLVEAIAAGTSYSPAESEIAALAYTYWVGRGCQGGSPEEDWLRAEQELRTEASA